MRDRRDPRKWTNREIEQDSEGYIAAHEAYQEDQATELQRAREADDLARFTDEYVRNGGRERDAATAFRTHRNRLAAEAASRADGAAARDTRERIKHTL